MVTVWSVRNSASPQELQSQELGGKKAGLEKGRESLHRPPGPVLLLLYCPVYHPTMTGSLREGPLWALGLEKQLSRYLPPSLIT